MPSLTLADLGSRTVADEQENPLHDNARSPRREKTTVREKITERIDGDGEPRNAKGQTQGEERDDVSDKSPIGDGGEHGQEHSTNSENPAGDAEGGGEGGDADMELKERRAMHKRHEAERNDHYGLHSKAMKDMQRRHDKEWKEMLFKQQNEMMPKDKGAAAEPSKPKKSPMHSSKEE